MKTALLVMVHGSPTPGANADLYRVLEVIRDRRCFDLVEPGFMECNQPTIPASIAQCVQQGAGKIIAVPYFLHTGSHVAEDLPAILDQARIDYPQVDLTMGRYIGASPVLTDLLSDRAAPHLSSL